MASILSDEQLEALVCSKCSKYLSMFPIKNYDNREVKCGRCNEEGDEGTKSLYELVVKKCLFKCVNRFEGCSKLLLPEHVAVHEKGCIGGTVVCPKCDDGNKRSVLDLIRHYKVQHPTRYVRKNSYKGSLTDKDTLLHIQDDVLFFISLQYSLDTLYISAATLTKEYVEQQFIVIAGSTMKVTETRLCKSWSESRDYCDVSLGSVMDPVQIIFNFNISKKYRKVYQVDLPLKVSNKTPSIKMTPSQVNTQVKHNAISKQGQSASIDEKRFSLLSSALLNPKVNIQVHNAIFKQGPSASTNEKTLKATPINPKVNTPVTHNAILKKGQSTSSDESRLKVTLINANFFAYFTLSDCQTSIVGLQGEKINLVCSNCKHLVGQFVYKCKLGIHFLCQDCRNWCHICKCLTERINFDLQQFVQVPCRWNCGQFIQFDHEYHCELNSKICPLCLSQIQVRDMTNHFMMEHQQTFSYKMNLAKYLERNHVKKSGEHYFLLCHKLFHLQWQQKPDNLALYELKLRHLENLENGRLAVVRTLENGTITYKCTQHIHVLIKEKPMLHLEMSKV